MTLDTYLDGSGLTEEAFGRLVGLSQPQVNRLRTGKNRPSWDALQRISSVTDGQVTYRDFLPALDEPAEAAQ